MNKSILVYSAAVGAAIVVIGNMAWFANSSSSDASAGSGVSSTNTPIAPGDANVSPPDQGSIKKLLQEMLRQIGSEAKSPVEKYMHDEIASSDQGRILRAFHDAVYMQYWPKSEVIPVLKGYLNDPAPLVRYLAARDFLIMGDKEGTSTLLSLVQSNAPVDGLSQDVRIQAVETLAQFRQTDAIPAIFDAYQKTQDGNYLAALIKLQASQAIPIIEAKSYFADPLALEDYGLVGARKFIPQITATFNSTQKPEVKAAAAWALATMTDDPNAINYLVQAGQAVINMPPEQPAIYGSGEQIMNYLGTIQTSQAKQVLEAGLSSADPAIVQAATLNLLFNQGGSAKANQVVAQAFTTTSNLLGVEMALNLAPLINDPQVQAAGQNFSKHDGSGAWQRAMDRKDWSVYNWTDGIYPVKTGK